MVESTLNLLYYAVYCSAIYALGELWLFSHRNSIMNIINNGYYYGSYLLAA